MQFNEKNSAAPGSCSRLTARLATPGGEVVTLLLLVLGAFLLRYAAIHPYQVIAGDGPSYVTITRQIFGSFSFTGSIHYPPFYPLLLGLANLLLHDYETAGMAVSMVMGSLLPVPVYLLGRSFFGRGAGYVAAAIVLVWPEFVAQSSTVLAYSTYFTMLMTGLYLLWLAHTRKTLLPAVGSGLFVAAAYLSRQEAFISMFAICCCLAASTLYRERRVRPLIPLLVAFGVFVAAILPYIVMVHQVMGIWTLAGKSVVTLTDTLGYYLEKLDLNRDPTFARIGYLDLIRTYPGYFPFIIKKNFAALVNVLPVPLVLFAVVGFCIRRRDEWGNDVRAFIVGALAPVVVLLTIFLISSAYIAPYVPFLLILGGHGLLSTEGWLRSLFLRRTDLHGGCRWLTALLVLGYALSGAYQQVPRGTAEPYNLYMDSGRYDHKQIGKILKAQLPKDAVIMTRSGRIAFYSGHPWVDIPQADFWTILSTAREKKVRYLIVSGDLATLRPQLEILLLPLGTSANGLVVLPQGQEPFPGLVCRMIYTAPQSQGFVVYELVR
jgi:4-amino-4-deoxy-L-arabinose transferase-like glycosyltransferase